MRTQEGPDHFKVPFHKISKDNTKDSVECVLCRRLIGEVFSGPLWVHIVRPSCCGFAKNVVRERYFLKCERSRMIIWKLAAFRQVSKRAKIFKMSDSLTQGGTVGCGRDRLCEGRQNHPHGL